MSNQASSQKPLSFPHLKQKFLIAACTTVSISVQARRCVLESIDDIDVTQGPGWTYRIHDLIVRHRHHADRLVVRGHNLEEVYYLK